MKKLQWMAILLGAALLLIPAAAVRVRAEDAPATGTAAEGTMPAFTAAESEEDTSTEQGENPSPGSQIRSGWVDEAGGHYTM